MATTNHFDLLVLGGDIAGLAAAALAAGRGLRVCVLPGDHPDGVVTLGHRTFPLQTAPFTAVSSPFVRVVYEELGLWLQMRRDIRAIPGLHHWRLSEASLDVRSGDENLDHEFSRSVDAPPLSPELRPSVAAAMEEEMEQLFRAAGLDPPVHRAIASEDAATTRAPKVSASKRELAAEMLGVDALAGWLSDAPPKTTPAAVRHRLRAHWGEGPLDFSGGLGGLRTQLISRIHSRSSEVKPRVHVDRIDVKRGRVSGVKLRGKNEHYGCDALLLACDPIDIFGKAAEVGGLSRDFARRLASVQRPTRRYVLHVAVGALGVSPVFSETLIATCPQSEEAPIQTLFVRRLDGALVDASPDTICLSVTAVVPSEIPTARLRELTIAALRRHGGLPFLDDHMRWSYSPNDTLGVVSRGVTDTQGSSSKKRPHGMESLYAFEGAGIGDGLPLETGVKRLLYAGRMSYPQLGLEGQYIAGLAAADGLSESKRGAASPRLVRR